MNPKGKLFLLPVPITEEQGKEQIPEHNLEIVRGLKHFIAEEARSARRFLKLCNYPKIEEAEIHLLNEHSRPEDLADLVQPLLKGENIGLMSDAGCPGIADPGAEVVNLAHQKSIEVVPLVGPSSIVLSIMASGFNGQNFAFNGYLPVDKIQRQKRIKELEQMAKNKKQAQFFIETPYRNQQMFEALLTTLQPETKLFIGKSILANDQYLKSSSVAEWKKTKTPDLHKVPLVFGIYA